MSKQESLSPAPRVGAASPLTYLRFLGSLLSGAFDGTWRFYVWMTALTAIALVGANAWAQQVAAGMHVTSMTDYVS